MWGKKKEVVLKELRETIRENFGIIFEKLFYVGN